LAKAVRGVDSDQLGVLIRVMFAEVAAMCPEHSRKTGA
jgi:hypothetical protein